MPKRNGVSPAKISRPVVTGAVPRARLFRELDRGRRDRLVWVSAPAGSGKTTLVSSYVAARGLPCLWYTVDAGDEDVATLFYYLNLAVAGARGQRAARALPRWSAEYPASLGVFSRRYFESLFSLLENPSVVVFDDAQEISENSAFYEALREAIASLPSGISVFILSRQKLPAALVRHGSLAAAAQLGWRDLRLSATETDAIARRRPRTGSPSFSQARAAQLHALTDGWAAGLVLLLQRENRHLLELEAPRPSQAPAEIFDYFAAEVFERSQAGLKEFLLKTAHLSTMSPATAERLTDMSNAGRILEALSRDGFFIERHGATEGTFRYHPLFRAFLLERASALLSAEALHDTRRRAARLLLEDDQIRDAFELLREVSDFDALAELIVESAPALLQQGRIQTLRSLFEPLPADEVEHRPWLLFYQATCLLGYDLAAAQTLLGRAFELFRKRRDLPGVYLAWAGAVQAIAYEGEDFHRVDIWTQRLEALQHEQPGFPSPDVESRVATAMVMAFARRMSFSTGRAWAERALVLSQQQPQADHRLMAAARLVIYRSMAGDVRAAAQLLPAFERAVDRIDPLVQLTIALARAVFSWAKGQLRASFDAARAGLLLAETTGVHVLDDELRVHVCCAGVILGELQIADDGIQLLSQAPRTRFQTGAYHLASGLRDLCRGDLRGALAQFETSRADAAALGYGVGESVSCLLALTPLLALGCHAEAVARLERVGMLAGQMDSDLFHYWSLIARAHVARTTGELAAAEAALRAAFELARANDYANPPWLLPPAWSALCASALAAGIQVDHVRQLVIQHDLSPPPEEDALTLESWPYPVEICTMGRFELNTRAPRESSRKVAQVPLRLLKVLVACGGHAVPEQELTDALWPASDGDLAARNLDTALHRLRKLLGHHEAISLSAGALTLDPRRCRVDTWNFEKLCGRIGDAPGDFVATSDELFALYRGPFLPQEGDAPWSERMRTRLRRHFSSTVVALANALISTGKHDDAAAMLRRGIDADDQIETLYRELMSILLGQGKHHEGLLVYERCTKALARSLGARPKSETHRLSQQLRETVGARPLAG